MQDGFPPEDCGNDESYPFSGVKRILLAAAWGGLQTTTRAAPGSILVAPLGLLVVQRSSGCLQPQRGGQPIAWGKSDKLFLAAAPGVVRSTQRLTVNFIRLNGY